MYSFSYIKNFCLMTRIYFSNANILEAARDAPTHEIERDRRRTSRRVLIIAETSGNPRGPANSVARSPWNWIQFEIKRFLTAVRRRSGGLYRNARGPMKKQLRYIITALAILLLPSVTQADEVTGKIALVDAEKHTITLTSGMTFFVAESISIVELIPGDDIEITFGRENGMLIAVKLSRSDGEA